MRVAWRGKDLLLWKYRDPLLDHVIMSICIDTNIGLDLGQVVHLGNMHFDTQYM